MNQEHCHFCNKKFNESEWEEHKLSKKHLENAGQKYCELCNMFYYTSLNPKKSMALYVIGVQHLDSDIHKKNQI